MNDRIHAISRRGLLKLLTTGAGLAVLGPQFASAQSREDVLVVGLDISDAVEFDPATSTAPAAQSVLRATLNGLVTMAPGDYATIRPSLAESWERTPDGKGWRFTLRKGVKFNSGNPVTPADWKWSFDRMINMKGMGAQFLPHVERTEVPDDGHFDIIMKDQNQPILEILCAPRYSVLERQVLEQHGGDASAEAETKDKASSWLTANSCGTGPYTLTGFERGSSIQFARNPHYWGGVPAFERLIIRHMTDSAAQLLAIQRGDIDVAFNLIPEQVALLKDSADIRIEQLRSLDQVYFAFNVSPDVNKAMAVKEARQAIAYAIDYQGIRDGLLAGNSLLAASIMPIGLLGSTEELAAEIGYREDLKKSKELLAKAGFPDGFSFTVNYGTALYAGVSYPVLAQKLQSDLARVGITVILNPVDLTTLRTQYYKGNAPSVIVNWGVSGVDNWLWAEAAVRRIAERLHYDPPKDLVKLVMNDAAAETDPDKKRELWIEFQKRMVDACYLLPLFQPIYQIPVRTTINKMPLTAAGGLVDFANAS